MEEEKFDGKNYGKQERDELPAKVGESLEGKSAEEG